jgi:fucose 4-O-acetylase-like acetyltransferase
VSERTGSRSPLDEMVAATPSERDRYVDLLRAASILAVVVGHWTIGLIWWEGGLLYLTSAIGVTTGLWLATWVFQVMPIFFFVGGFSNLVALDGHRRRSGSTMGFVRSRVARLLRPSLVFLGIWVVVQVVLHLTDVGTPAGLRLWGDTHLLRGMNPPAATLPFGPLWFLGAYLVVVSISPITVALHRRFGLWVPAVMAAGVVVVDVLGFVFGRTDARYLNIAFVLLFPHQLGHAYGDGRFARTPRWVWWTMAIGGLAALVLLTNPPLFELLGGDDRFRWFPGIGYYPKSMLGTEAELISNAYPPTLCYLAVGIWTIGAAMLLRPRISRWLERPGPWKATIAANSVIMTLFLWHMTAYLLAILAMWPLGFGREHATSARWWLERPLWLAVPGVILAGLVLLFRRFERAPARRELRPA